MAINQPIIKKDEVTSLLRSAHRNLRKDDVKELSTLALELCYCDALNLSTGRQVGQLWLAF